MPNGCIIFVSLCYIYRNYRVKDIELEYIKPMDPRIPGSPRLILGNVIYVRKGPDVGP